MERNYTGVECHTHENCLSLGQPYHAPLRAVKRPLGLEGRSESVRGVRKDGVYRVANGSEDISIVGGDRLAQHRIVAGERGWHRSRVLLPEPGAPNNIGEQEGDGAAR